MGGGIVKSIKFLILFFIALFIGVSTGYAKDITLDKFHADIKIYEDSKVIVKEIIEVEFHIPRRGIFRDIPYIYRDDLGKRIKTPLKVINIEDEKGKQWEYKISKQGGIVSIRIGNPNKYLTGKQTYVITYSVDNVLLFLSDRDELYWNVTGNGWDASINNAGATVTLPSAKEIKNKWASCYTGVLGSKESKCSYKLTGDSIEFKSRDLNPYEGLTIAYGWDKGLIKKPDGYNRLIWELKDNWIFSLPLLSFLFMFLLWYFGGRDPKVSESVAVQYQPPIYTGNALTPAEIGVLIDERLDMRDITASIVGLAVKGFIKIEEKELFALEETNEITKNVLKFAKFFSFFDITDYSLTKTKKTDASLTEFEQKLMGALFESGKTISISELKNKFYKNIPDLNKIIYKCLISKNYFKSSPDMIRASYKIAGFIISVLGLILGIIVSENIGEGAILAGILTGVPLFGFARFMPAKTISGAKALIDVKGFEEFLSRAEKDRLERMKDENLFEKYLPYAIALNVVDRWASAFEGIYQKPPEWYSSPRGFGVFSTNNFASRIDGAMSKMSAAMASAPRSSGSGSASGGGGSSGGGFGGGGGRSW